MNETISRLIREGRDQIKRMDAEISEHQATIASATETLEHAEQRKAEWLSVIEKLGGAAKHKVQWFNTDNLTDKYPASVVVHAEGCKHIEVSRQDPYMKAGFETVSDVEEWESAEQFAKDYNADFYAEDGPSGCWSIAFFPCTGMVDRLTITTGYDED